MEAAPLEVIVTAHDVEPGGVAVGQVVAGGVVAVDSHGLLEPVPQVLRSISSGERNGRNAIAMPASKNSLPHP